VLTDNTQQFCMTEMGFSGLAHLSDVSAINLSLVALFAFNFEHLQAPSAICQHNEHIHLINLHH
jgi:hypothetical protein